MDYYGDRRLISSTVCAGRLRNLLTELTGSIAISRLESAGPPMSNNTSNEKDSKHGVIKYLVVLPFSLRYLPLRRWSFKSTHFSANILACVNLITMTPDTNDTCSQRAIWSIQESGSAANYAALCIKTNEWNFMLTYCMTTSLHIG